MGVAAVAKRIGAKVPPILNRTRKSTLILRLRTVASANCTRFPMFLQTPTKNVQELAKEEGEESETKLRVATVTSEGAIPAVAGKRQDTWRVIS